MFDVWINRDYGMVGECVRFLCTSCDRDLSQQVHNKNRTNEPTICAVICLFQTYRDHFDSGNLSKANNVETKY